VLRTAILSLLVLLLVPASQAAPPEGKKGGGGKGGGSGPQPELHFQWRVQLNGPYSAVRPALGPDGTIYAVDVFDHLFAVAPDGTVRWAVADAGSKGVDVGPDGTIYTGNENWIKAFHPDGTLKWTFVQSPRAFVFIDVAVGPDGNVYAVASSGMGVFSLADTPAGPQLRWTNPEPYSRIFVGYTELEFGPTADGRDEQLYFYANGHTRAVRLSDGASIFTLGGGNTRPRVSPFDGTWHRPASAFDPSGQLVWSFEFPLATGTREPTLGQDGTHYSVNSGTDLYAIDPFGRQEWVAGLDEFVGLADIDPTDSILILDTQRTSTHPAALKAVSATNGGPLWRMEFPGDETGLDQFVDSGASFSSDGATAYVMTAIAGGGTGLSRCYLNAVDTDPALPSASTQLRSTEVWLDARSRRNGVNFTGNVTVTDENRGSVSGATVHATWTLPDGSTVSDATTTGGTGVAKFNLSGPGGLYRLTVDQIARDGYDFDPQHSVLEGARAWF
jgi:hypothetical protein